MRSALVLLSLVALAGCDDLFETNDHDYDFPAGASGAPTTSVPTNVQPPRRPSSSSSSSGFTFEPSGPPDESVTAYVEIEASDHYTCALRADHGVDCWGDTLADQPTKLTELGGSAKTACGTDENGALRCWGAAEGFDAPIGGRLSLIGVGDGFACGLDDDQHPHCWGPKAITPPADETLGELAVGTNHACGLRTNGTAVCWGIGSAAEPPKDTIFHGIAAGAATTCALTQDEQGVFCWGLLAGAQPAKGIERLAVTLGKACGIRASDHHLECWGLAQKGDWLEPPASVPFLRLSIGVTHACGVRHDNGLAICWGSNTAGESTPPF